MHIYGSAIARFVMDAADDTFHPKKRSYDALIPVHSETAILDIALSGLDGCDLALRLRASVPNAVLVARFGWREHKRQSGPRRGLPSLLHQIAR